MTTRTRRGAAILGLLAGSLVSCAAHPEKKQQAGPAPQAAAAQGAQQPAQTAAERAAQADQQLAQARQRLEAAHQASIQAEQQRAQARQNVTLADQRAAQAQQQIGVEQANVQRLEQSSRDAHAMATDEAMQSQLAAEQALGLRSVTGRISQTSPSRVTLQASDGELVTFGIDGQTRVLMGTEQRSVADLQQGAQARVAYDPQAAQPRAFVIHVNPARERPAPAPQALPPQPAQ